MLVLLGSKVTSLDNNEAFFLLLVLEHFLQRWRLGLVCSRQQACKTTLFSLSPARTRSLWAIGWVPDAEFEAVSGKVEDYCNDAVRVYSACICPWEA